MNMRDLYKEVTVALDSRDALEEKIVLTDTPPRGSQQSIDFGIKYLEALKEFNLKAADILEAMRLCVVSP